MLLVSSDGLEELYDAFSCYFWLLVWAPRFWEGVSNFSKSPSQVRLSSSSLGSLLRSQFSAQMHFDRSCNFGVILSII
jgi:hypothetical protein